MPLYEYQCKQCGHRFERIQSFSAEPIKQCPVCSGEVEKLISAFAMQFKGSGFYSTDYAKPSAKTEQSSGDGSSKAASNGAGSSSDKSSGGKTEKSAPAKSESTTSSVPASKPASGD